MGITDSLKQWLKENSVNYAELGFGRVHVKGLGSLIEFIPREFGNTIDVQGKMFTLNIGQQVIEYIIDNKVDHVIYEFGGNHYYTPISHIANAQMVLLKNVGGHDDSLIPDFGRAFLGVHGRYEMMNGSRDYQDWCDKAKFLKFKALGICEKNTLAGTLPFQMACVKNKLQPIIGYTVEVENGKGEHFDLRLYCINTKGWRNLLRINKLVNVDQEGFAFEKQLLEYGEGLLCCISPGMHATKLMLTSYKRAFDKTMFQITTNEYAGNVKDKEILSSIKNYLDNFRSIVDPILISDAYCIDKDDTHIRTVLNKQGKVQFNHSTTNHYFRSLSEQFVELEPLFRIEDGRLEDVYIDSFESLDWVIENCKFNINTKELFLPKYEMTEAEQSEYNGETSDFFDDLIADGMRRKFEKELSGPNGDSFENELWERVDSERAVIVKGGFIDYFLILWDIVNWCKTQNIQTGPGRGSAAGCLISYLLGIVKINPLRYDLIFERFLNESRIQSELPDIDIDFASDRRDEVIEYMKKRYGEDYVCRVGTYGTLQMRGVLKELARAYGVQGDKYNMNFVTKLISQDNGTWEPLFKDAASEPLLKQFVIDNPRIVNDARIALNSIKSASVHACATIIVPKIADEEGNSLNIYDQIPVRKDSDGTLISEWEGDVMADAGFLKEDILSTKQMAKIGSIFDLVKEREGIQLDMEEIPLDDENVYRLFQKGLNQDVFHFGSSGLTIYLKDVHPENIDELIACIALYRPGAMASNAHTDFVKLKKGEKEVTHDYLLQSVTSETYGLYIYQEQIMKAAQTLGDFSLAEADGVRKAMGKKIKDKMDSYKVQFVKGAVNKGCDKLEAEKIWNKMEVFAGYGFNKSHAAAYSVIGYYCNWLKYHYPLEFWTVAFQYAKNEKIQDFVAEIKRMGHIGIVAPDINKSHLEFHSDPEQYKIYWNLSQIKYVGEAAASAIIEGRDKDGKFFSIEEFNERVPSRAVNKRTVEHLILAGCFDEMYSVRQSSDRLQILQEYYELRKEELPKEYKDNRAVDHYWSIRQAEVSKLSNLDYIKLFRQTQFANYTSEYVSSEEVSKPLERKVKQNVMIAGTVVEAVIRKTKKDKREYAVIRLMQDQYQMQVRVWPQQLNPNDDQFDVRFDGLKEFIEQDKNKLCVFRGVMEYNDYVKGNEIVLSDRINGPTYEIF
jgi:DNA polymerase-3 subunit alpha